jgi:hypothetical protein
VPPRRKTKNHRKNTGGHMRRFKYVDRNNKLCNWLGSKLAFLEITKELLQHTI